MSRQLTTVEPPPSQTEAEVVIRDAVRNADRESGIPRPIWLTRSVLLLDCPPRPPDFAEWVEEAAAELVERTAAEEGRAEEGRRLSRRLSVFVALAVRSRRRHRPLAVLRILASRLLGPLLAGWVWVVGRLVLPPRSPPAADPLAFGIPRHGPPTLHWVEEVSAVT